MADYLLGMNGPPNAYHFRICAGTVVELSRIGESNHQPFVPEHDLQFAEADEVSSDGEILFFRGRDWQIAVHCSCIELYEVDNRH